MITCTALFILHRKEKLKAYTWTIKLRIASLHRRINVIGLNWKQAWTNLILLKKNLNKREIKINECEAKVMVTDNKNKITKIEINTEKVRTDRKACESRNKREDNLT